MFTRIITVGGVAVQLGNVPGSSWTKVEVPAHEELRFVPEQRNFRDTNNTLTTPDFSPDFLEELVVKLSEHCAQRLERYRGINSDPSMWVRVDCTQPPE